MSGLFYFTLCFGVHSHCSVNQYFIPFCALVSPVQLFGTPGAVTRQPPLSMGFCRQEYWGGLPCPPPEELPYPGIKPKSSALASGFFTSCCKKLSHTWWFETTEIHSLPVPEARSLKTRCVQSHAFSGGAGDNLFLASPSFWWLPDFLGLCLNLSNHQD